MSESIQAFWYRPFWQQALSVGLFISLCLLVGYFLHWEDSKKHLIQLTADNVNLLEKITKEKALIHQSPSISQLSQQIQKLEQVIDVKGSHEIMTLLNTLFIHSSITLNQLQPTTNNSYFMEFQGSFAQINRFIEQLLSHPQTQKWHLKKLKIILKQGVIVTSMTFSLFNSPLTIKDDNHDE